MALEGLNGLIKGLEGQPNWQSQRQFRLVVLHWPKAVGFAVSRKTRPVSIQRSTLYVATATAVWAQTLSYERLKILRKLNVHQQQPLKDIRFSTAQWQQRSIETASGSQPLEHHPSYVVPTPNQTSPELFATNSSQIDLPQTPETAFNRWANTIRQMQSTQALCPLCQCRCPQGELDRWSVCALCAAKKMH